MLVFVDLGWRQMKMQNIIQHNILDMNKKTCLRPRKAQRVGLTEYQKGQDTKY